MMALSDDARKAIRRVWSDGRVDVPVLNAKLPDGRTVGQALDEGEEWRRWGQDLAQPALTAIMSGDAADQAAARAAIARWDARGAT